jgi:hypothetical protein
LSTWYPKVNISPAQEINFQAEKKSFVKKQRSNVTL